MRGKTIEGLLIIGLFCLVTWLLKPAGVWFDKRLMELLETVHMSGENSVLYRTATWVTLPGSTMVFIVITAALLLLLLNARRFAMFWRMSVFLLGGVLLNTILKFIISRSRPYDVVVTLDIIGNPFNLISYSFPSGHALRVTLLALALSMMIARFSRTSIHTKRWLYTLLFLLSLAAIMSRPVLGIHFPTDVLAAAVYACLWLFLVMRYFPEKKDN